MPKRKRGIRKLTDVEEALAISKFVECDGDLQKAYRALKRKIPKRTLQKYHDQHNWPVIHLYERNKLIEKAVGDVMERKHEALRKLLDAQDALYKRISGHRLEDGTFVPPTRAKSLEGVVEALIRAIEKEMELIDTGEKKETEAQPGGLLMLVQQVIREQNGATSDSGDDPFGLGEGLSRFEIRGEEDSR